jgi:hypothetical protein
MPTSIGKGFCMHKNKSKFLSLKENIKIIVYVVLIITLIILFPKYYSFIYEKSEERRQNSENEISHILFEEVSADEFKKLYPQILLKQLDQDGLDIPPAQISVSEIDIGIHKKIIVVKMEGSLYCGTLGCSTELYNLEGKSLFEVSTHELFIQKCDSSKPIFILYDGKQYVRWNIFGSVAKLLPGKYNKLSNIPACMK